MKVLVTVGTTKFDDLIRTADFYFENNKEIEVVYQLSDGEYIPSSGRYFDYDDNIEEIYNESDLIISHAGAGSTFKLLEMGKKIILVPNIQRIDKHQLDIAKYMFDNQHVLVLFEMSDFDVVIDRSKDFIPKCFIKEPFFKGEELDKIIFESY